MCLAPTRPVRGTRPLRGRLPYLVFLRIQFEEESCRQQKDSGYQINHDPGVAVEMDWKEGIEKYSDKPENPNPFFFLSLVRHPRDICSRREHDKTENGEKSVLPAVKESEEQNRRRDDQRNIFLIVVAHRYVILFSFAFLRLWE